MEAWFPRTVGGAQVVLLCRHKNVAGGICPLLETVDLIARPVGGARGTKFVEKGNIISKLGNKQIYVRHSVLFRKLL